MFILMGGLAYRCGLSYDLFRGANAWIGRFRGGIAMAAVAACGGFGAVCGSSTATASTMGQVALPELKRYGYQPALATGTLAAGGTLGILIPPSIVLIVYAIIVEANVVTLFAAALIPGLLAVLFFIITVAIYVRLVPNSGPAGPPVAGTRCWRATLGVVPVLVVFGIVIGGIYAGIYNPTPAAAIGVFPGRALRLRPSPPVAARHGRGPAGDGAHQRHDLPHPARRRAPEDLHGARRRAAGRRRDAAGQRPPADGDHGADHPDLHRPRLPDGQPLDDHPVHRRSSGRWCRAWITA